MKDTPTSTVATDEAEEPRYTYERTPVQNLLRQKPSGRYYGRWSVSGKDIWKSLKTTVFSVAKLRVGEESRKIETRRGSRRSITSGTGTMKDIIATYEARVAALDVSASTKAGRLKGVKKVLQTWKKATGAANEFGDIKPRDITPRDVEAWAIWIKTNRHGMVPNGASRGQAGNSATTVNTAIDALRRLMSIAKEQGMITSNPVTEQPENVRLKKKVVNKRATVPDDKLVAQLLDEMERSKAWAGAGHEAANLCRFLMFSGARLGEAAKSRWGHINWEANTLWIDGYKTESSDRYIPIFPALGALLRRIKAEREQSMAAGWGQTPCGPNDPIFRIKSCKRSLEGAAKRAGVPRLRHHDFRHVFVSTCIEAGANWLTISKWVGHTTPRLIMETYGHLRDEHSQSEAAKMVIKPELMGGAR